MIEYKLIKNEEDAVIIEYSKKRYTITSCSDCPFIDWIGSPACDLTEEIFYTDVFNEYGKKCPFLYPDLVVKLGVS